MCVITAAAAGGTMAAVMANASLAATAIAGAYSAYSQNQSGKFNAQVAEQNAKIQDAAAQDAQIRGANEANKQRQRTAQAIGHQNTALAANGLEINSGSALSLTNETAVLGELDARTIQDNALHEAYGYSVNAANSRTQGSIAQAEGRNNATGTLLTTGASLLSSSYRLYGNPFVGKNSVTPSADAMARNVKGSLF